METTTKRSRLPITSSRPSLLLVCLYVYNIYLSYICCRAGHTKGDRFYRIQEGCSVPRRRGVMSEQLKEEIAKELGFYDVVQREGWGGIRARDAGNMVKRAIEMAEEQLGRNREPT